MSGVFEIDYTNPNSLLVAFQPNDTDETYYVYKPLTQDFTTLRDVILDTGSNTTIPINVSARALKNFLDYRAKPWGGTIKNAKIEEIIEIVEAFDYLGIGTDASSYEGIGPLSDQICENYTDRGIKWERFNKVAKENGWDLYHPLELIKTLKKMTPEIQAVEEK